MIFDLKDKIDCIIQMFLDEYILRYLIINDISFDSSNFTLNNYVSSIRSSPYFEDKNFEF